jgi:hypothetical protein
MTNLQEPNTKKRITIIALFAAFLLLRIPAFTLVDHNWSDINLYKMLSDRILAGQTPYVDFQLEYPPLALIFFAIPGLISSITGNFDIPYRLLMMLFDIGCLILIGKIAKRLTPSHGKTVVFAQISYLIFSAISFQVLYDRFDIAVAFLILLSIYLAIAGNWLWAYVVVILGAFTKLFPIILLPLVAIYQYRRSRMADIIRDLGIALVTGIILLIVSIAIFGDWWGYMLDYHGKRGIQIESLYSSIAMLANFAGVQAAVGHEYGAFQISNPFTGFMTKVSMILMGCSILAVYCIFARDTKRSARDNGHFIIASMLALISFALFNKVLSPQFFLWLFPLAAIVLATIPYKALWGIFWLIIAVLTTLIFPYYYRSLVALEGTTTLLIIRNACFAAVAAMGFRMLFIPASRYQTTPH